VSGTSSTWTQVLTTSTCDVDTTHADNVDQLLRRLLDATRADTTRYHVTDSAMTSSGDEERHDDDVTPEVESAPWSDERWSRAWTLFVALDLLLLAARATVTYVNATEIYRGGRRPQRQSPPYHQPAVDHHIANGQPGSMACSRLKSSDTDRAALRWSWSLAVDAVSSRSLLVAFHVSSLIALLYLAARVATSSAAVDVITDVIYDVYTQRVRAHVSMSDAVIKEQAELTTSSLMQSAQQFDLLALQVFDQYFRLGNRRFKPFPLSARRYPSAVYAVACYPSVRHKPGFCRNGSSWFWAQRLPSANPTLFVNEIRVSSILRVLPTTTLFQALNVANFSGFFAPRHVDHRKCYQLSSTDDQ